MVDITDKSKNVDNKDQNNKNKNIGVTDKNTGILYKVKNPLGAGSLTNGLAIILIVGVIGAIVGLIYIHQHTLEMQQNTYKDILTKITDKTNPLYGDKTILLYCNHFKIITEKLIFLILIY